MQKKILFISDHGDPLAKLGGVQSGGQNNYVYQLALALEEQGATVDVVTHWSDSDTPKIEKFSKKCRVIRFSAGQKGFIDKNEMYHMLPVFYEEINSYLPLRHYDVVHTHYWLSGLLGLKIKAEHGLPVVHTSHSLGIAKERATGIRDERRLNSEKKILKNVSAIIATTSNERKLIQEFAANPAPVYVIPIGVAPVFRQKYHRLSLKKSLGYPHPLLVFAGRLEETKGIFTLLEAFQSLVRREEVEGNSKLVIAGGDEEEIDLYNKQPTDREILEAINGIEHRVEFIGPRSQEELAILFNAATITIVPSYYESFGMVAAEAQACGSPVIASNVGGLRDVINNGETGLHVEPEDPEDLSITMQVVIENDFLAKRLSKQAAIHATKTYKWSAISENVMNLYEEVHSLAQKQYTSSSYRFGRDISG